MTTRITLIKNFFKLSVKSAFITFYIIGNNFIFVQNQCTSGLKAERCGAVGKLYCFTLCTSMRIFYIYVDVAGKGQIIQNVKP